MNIEINFFKQLTITSLFLVSASVQSGQQGMSEEQMQKLMQQANAMQSCFENIDQSAFKQLEADAHKMEAEIKSLCQAGKKDEAQDAAINYGKKFTSSKEVQEMKKCGAMAEQMIAQMPVMPETNNAESSHVCDGI